MVKSRPLTVLDNDIKAAGISTDLSCLTVSFNLQETFLFQNTEMSSRVFVAYLNGRKAFDTVWRKCLMFKLNRLGVKGELWEIIDYCTYEH